MLTRPTSFDVVDPDRPDRARVVVVITRDGRWKAQLRTGNTLIDRHVVVDRHRTAIRWAEQVVAEANDCLDDLDRTHASVERRLAPYRHGPIDSDEEGRQ